MRVICTYTCTYIYHGSLSNVCIFLRFFLPKNGSSTIVYTVGKILFSVVVRTRICKNTSLVKSFEYVPYGERLVRGAQNCRISLEALLLLTILLATLIEIQTGMVMVIAATGIEVGWFEC